MKRESRTVDRSHQGNPPTQRHLPLVDLLVDTRAELMELAVASGLKVLTMMLEEDRTVICGPRYQHQPERQASRAGTVPSEVVLGGRKVAIRRPRVRHDGAEVTLPTFQAFANSDPLNRRVVEQMLVGRRHSPVRPQFGTGTRPGGESRHEQERGEPALRRENTGPTRSVAVPAARRPRFGRTRARWRPRRGALPDRGPSSPW